MAGARTALVTGATGLVGRHLARRLIEDGWRVRALVRGDLRRRRLDDGAEAIAGDLARPASLRGITSGADAVFHLAATTGEGSTSTREAQAQMVRVNRDGTQALAREAMRAGIRMVHVSSDAVVGTGSGASEIDEDTPCSPVDAFGRSKLMAEHVLREMHGHEGLDSVVLRPSTVAGPGKKDGEIARLVRLAGLGIVPILAGTEHCVKPIIWIGDLVEAVLLAFERGRGGGTYFVHDGMDHTLGEIVAAAGRVCGKARPGLRLPAGPLDIAARVTDRLHRLAPYFDPPLTVERLEVLRTSRRISISRARTELGFVPGVTSLDEMLSLSI